MKLNRKDKWLPVIILWALVAVMTVAIMVVLWMRRHGGTESSAPSIEEKLKLGQRYLSEMDYDNAITAFTEAIQVDERNTEAYVGLGDAHSGKGDWTQAVKSYDEAVKTVADVMLTENVEESPTEEKKSLRSFEQNEETDIYTTKEEKALLASLEGMSNDTNAASSKAAPVAGITVESIDAEYVSGVIESRNQALESGIKEIYDEDKGLEEMQNWLEEVDQPLYKPQNETLIRLFPVDEATADLQFDGKIHELAAEYGVLSFGPDTLVAYYDYDADADWGPHISQEDIDRNCGLLFADRFDYDNDSIKELLVLRRESISELDYEVGSKQERTGIVLEMYETGQEGCVLADSMELGIEDAPFDEFGNASFDVFRRSTKEETAIYVEACVIEMDHGPDVSMVSIRYKDRMFTEADSVRFGCWYEDMGYFVPATEEAIMHLSGWDFRDNTWKALAFADSGYSSDDYETEYARIKKEFEQGLEEIGLFSTAEIREDLTLAADSCYVAVNGDIQELGRICIDHDYDASSNEYEKEVFVFTRVDSLGTLDAYRSDAGSSDASGSLENYELSTETHETGNDAESDLTMEDLNIPYGHSEGAMGEMMEGDIRGHQWLFLQANRFW